MVFLALVDRAAAHQFRHFVKSPYEPFRRACQETLKEEYGHVGLGMDGVKDLLRTAEGRAEVEQAVRKWLPVGLASFGGDRSRTNERFRHWGLKSDTNEGMRETYYRKSKLSSPRTGACRCRRPATRFIAQLGGSLKQHAIYVAG